jgi:F-type H+-transporting ATPase subunit a
VALAVRLFGNMMSGHLVVAILVSLAPLFFPVAMQVFGLLIGVIQAYVFAVLALVYIASGARVYEAENEEDDAAQPLPSSTADV